MKNFLIIALCIFFYTYLFYSFELTPKMIKIYKDPTYKVIFLLTLYFFGYYNEYLTLFIAINYVALDLKIKNHELLKGF